MAGLSGDDAPVIRIVRKKSGGGGHHGGAWKVAYADFVTAMMAFFLVMWILGLDKPLRESIASYFRDPVGFMKTAHGGPTPLGKGGEGDLLKKGKPAPFIPEDAGKGAQAAGQAAMEAAFKKAAETILKELEKNPDFSGLRDSVNVHLTNEGLRIELMEKTSSLFFDSGSAALKERTVRLLALISAELKNLDNPIVIEGHTDSRPLSRGDNYTNWELSADRANAARRAMEAHGLPAKQVLAVRGYADHKLLRREDPLHYSNRRVSILVAYTGQGQ